MSFTNKQFLSSKQNLIIFSLVLIFAAQFLFFTDTYMINFPYMYDTTSLRILIEDGEFLGEDFTIYDFFENLFEDTNSRGIIFPKLVVLPNYLLNNFDSSNIFYLNFIILSLTLFFIFLMLRETNKKIFWTLIPISAFLFSPLINNNYWNYTILIWYLPALCIAAATYFLIKKPNLKNISFAIILSVVSSYSIPLGLTIWVPGILMMIGRYKEKIFLDKIPIIYFASMILTGVVYYFGNIQSQNIVAGNDFFSLDTVAVFFTFVAVPFKLKFDELMITAGIASTLVAIFLIYYLGIIKNKFKEIFPWILFLSVGVCAALLMRIGRFDPYFKGNLPYYSPISEFFQIGILIMTAIAIYEIRNNYNFKNKKFLLFILYSIIIIQMIFLIPSYYNGWWKGDYYFEQKTEYVNCYSLQQNWENCKTNYILAQNETETYYNKFVIYNFFLRNNFNIFSEIDFNKEIKKDLDDFKNKFDSIPNIEIVEGQFTVVNNLTNVEKVNIINEQALITSGYLIAPNNFKIEALYLIVDNEPLSKSVHFIQTQNTSENHETIKWTFALLKEYLPDGCSKISLGGIANQEPFLVKNPIEICKK